MASQDGPQKGARVRGAGMVAVKPCEETSPDAWPPGGGQGMGLGETPAGQAPGIKSSPVVGRAHACVLDCGDPRDHSPRRPLSLQASGHAAPPITQSPGAVLRLGISVQAPIRERVCGTGHRVPPTALHSCP